VSNDPQATALDRLYAKVTWRIVPLMMGADFSTQARTAAKQAGRRQARGDALERRAGETNCHTN
jgi:hypothetical protein